MINRIIENRITILLPFLVSVVFVGSWLSAFQKLFIRWGSGDNSYAYLIIPLFLYICWENRHRFDFSHFRASPFALIPAILSAITMVAGELGSVETLLYIGIWLAFFSLGVFLYGMELRRLIFPWILLLFMIPLPPFINNMLTFNLKLAASALATQMLRLSGVSVLREGNIIDIGVEKLQVVDACSGLRFLIPMLLMALLVGYFFNKKKYSSLMLLLVVPPLSVLINGFRVYATALLLLGGHKKLADGLFHDFAGWVVFMAGGTFLLLFSFLLRKLERVSELRSKDRPARSGERSPENLKDKGSFFPPKRSFQALITAVLMMVIFAGSAWSVSGRSLEQGHPGIVRTPFNEFPMTLGEWQGKRHYLSDEIMGSLWADDYVSALFRHPEQGSAIQLFIPYYEYQATGHTAHAPQSCLLGGGWAILSSDDRVVQLNEESITIRVMIMKKDEVKLIASYFFFQRGRVITSPWMNKAYLMWDALTRKRTDGALVRVELILAENKTLEDAFGELELFLGHLWPVLPKYIPE
jgi:exosortase D (VPLPA-CTERM-specific)